MKKTIHNIIVFTLCLIMTGCISRFEEYNTDPNSIPEMNPSMLLPAMIDHLMYVQQNNSQIVDQMVGSLGGYFAISNRFGGQNFDTFNASDVWNATPYSNAFTGIYANYFEIQKMTGSEGPYFAMARILRAAVMMRIADLYGGIPYSKVSDGLTYVEYDTCEEVYRNIIKDLEEGAETLYSFTEQYPGMKPLKGKDDIYDGDYSLWARFANSMILRAAMRSGDMEAFKKAAGHKAGVIEENSQNAVRNVGLQPNPYQLASVSWGDLRINSSIVDYMEGFKDPRTEVYFTTSTFKDIQDRYIGMRTGEATFEKSDVSGYSQPNFEVNSSIPVFVAAETRFLMAEAALKKWVEGDAGTLYKEGIRLSMEQYHISSSAADTYISDNTSIPSGHSGDPRGEKYDYIRNTKVTIAWDESKDEEEKLEQIITQKWIAIYPMGLEAWAEFRRTGFPELAPPLDNLSNGIITDSSRGMRRLKYPYTEKDHNRDNYDAAVSRLGGPDNEATELFWTRK